VRVSGATRNVFRDLATSGNGGDGITLTDGAARNRFTGALKVGGNAGLDCSVAAAAGDLSAGSCAASGASDALVTTGLSLANSFEGKVLVDDSVNLDDVQGSALFDTLSDFGGFENSLRGWGRNAGAAFPDVGNRGPCVPGENCRIWDWRLKPGASAELLEALSVPTGDAVEVGRLPGRTEFLVHAVELLDDGVGNDNGLCESGEDCLYTPNFGSDQGPELDNGDGVLVEMPVDAIGAGGPLAGIRLFRRSVCPPGTVPFLGGCV